MEIKVKIMLADDDGQGFLGGGRYRLLREIAGEGSLQKAAQKLGLSYRKAWGDIRAIEEHLGFAVVDRHRGGSGGGGTSKLTGKAEKLLEIYGGIVGSIEKIVTDKNQKLRSNINER